MARDDVSERIARALFDMIGLQFVASGRASVNPASTAAEASSDTVQTVTGAALGDFALASWETDVLTGVNGIIQSFVSAADSVTHHLINNTVAAGAAIDVAATNVQVTVLRRAR